MHKLEGYSALYSTLSPALKPSIISPAAFFITKYLDDDLQYTFKTILEVGTPITLPLIMLPKNLYERLFKAKFLNVYSNKTHIEYYNFFQLCKTTLSYSWSKDPIKSFWQTHYFKIKFFLLIIV